MRSGSGSKQHTGDLGSGLSRGDCGAQYMGYRGILGGLAEPTEHPGNVPKAKYASSGPPCFGTGS